MRVPELPNPRLYSQHFEKIDGCSPVYGLSIISKLGTMWERARMMRERVGTMLELLGTMWECLGRLGTPGDVKRIREEIIWKRLGAMWERVNTMCGRYGCVKGRCGNLLEGSVND